MASYIHLLFLLLFPTLLFFFRFYLFLIIVIFFIVYRWSQKHHLCSIYNLKIYHHLRHHNFRLINLVVWAKIFFMVFKFILFFHINVNLYLVLKKDP